jgi:hypothetical protein
MDIPCMLPIPDAGIIPQSFPIVAASFIDSDGDAAALADVAGAALLDVADAAAAGLPLLLAALPQAAAVTASAAATSGIAATRRARELSDGRIASPQVRELIVVTRRRGDAGLALRASASGRGGELQMWA